MLKQRLAKKSDNNVEKMRMYGFQPLKLRWREHILCLMYRQSKKRGQLDTTRTHTLTK